MLGDTGFDNRSDWHSTIDLSFTLTCDRCSARAGLDRPMVDDGGDGFRRRCVALADACQAAGWTDQGGCSGS